jgi:hypothetical protein
VRHAPILVRDLAHWIDAQCAIARRSNPTDASVDVTLPPELDPRRAWLDTMHREFGPCADPDLSGSLQHALTCVEGLQLRDRSPRHRALYRAAWGVCHIERLTVGMGASVMLGMRDAVAAGVLAIVAPARPTPRPGRVASRHRVLRDLADATPLEQAS